MVVLITLVVASVIGIGVVVWLLKNDQASEKVSISDNPPQPTIAEEDLTSQPQEETDESHLDVEEKTKFSFSKIKDLLANIPLPGKRPKLNPTARNSEPLPSLKDYLEQEKKKPSPGTGTGTAAIMTSPTDPSEPEHPTEKSSLSEDEEKNIEKEIELSTALSELKEKHAKLDAMFNEKSAELQKAQESLENELKNRKEFNKVKDLLEKELKDSKDKTRQVQVDLNTAQTESETHKKRITQLEEKSTRLEKDILEKEDKINELVKRLQTFASPSTAATPPKQDTPENPQKGPDESSPVEQSTPEEPAGKPAESIIEENKGEEVHPKEKETPDPAIEAEVPARLDGEENQPDEPSESPEQDQPLKLQPDILSQEPQPAPEEEKKDIEVTPPEQAPEDPSNDQESNDQESNNQESNQQNNNEKKE